MKLAFATAVVLGVSPLALQAQELTVLTAGDQNMVDYLNEYLGPRFEAAHPGVTVRAVGTGPGDAGSQRITERFAAQSGANSTTWDADVAVVHEKFVGPMVESGWLADYRDQIATGALVTRANADMALGADVRGYVMPMFNSQIALAYNPAMVETPPASFDALREWAAAHPRQFGYNGIVGGASGVGFVMGWVYAYGGNADALRNGPFVESDVTGWEDAFAGLQAFNATATMTPGNAGTLDALARGDIAMGPVWVDMFYSWKANGQLPEDFRLTLPEPGLPGQPMHYVIPEHAAQPELARQFVEMATSPEVQAEGIVERFNWYPGIDAEHVQAELDPAVWDRLFIEITPEDIATRGLPFPIAQYNSAILEAYETYLAN